VREPDRDLKTEVFSARLEAIASELLKILRNEFCFTKLEVQDNESVNDLNHELFSAKLVDGPIDAIKLIVRPLKKELARLSESLRVLNREVCSVKLETEPNEALSVTARPLRSELARPRESMKDLKSELLSARLETDPNEALKLT